MSFFRWSDLPALGLLAEDSPVSMGGPGGGVGAPALTIPCAEDQGQFPSSNWGPNFVVALFCTVNELPRGLPL